MLSAAFSLTMLYGFIFGWRRLKVNEVMLEFDNLPAAFDGYRIVQLSDLHLGSLGESSSFIGKLVSEVNKLEADAVAFTGDLVNRSADEAVTFIPILSSLKAKDGVYSVLATMTTHIHLVKTASWKAAEKLSMSSNVWDGRSC